jgi:hypothetical protein
MKEGPMKTHMEDTEHKIIKAEYTTYRIKDGMLTKDTSVRSFKDNGDYNDSYHSEPLAKVK